MDFPTASLAPTELHPASPHDKVATPPLPEQQPTLPLHPADNLLAYMTNARLPQLPRHLEDQLRRRVGRLAVSSSSTTTVPRSRSVSLRTNRTRLTANPKEGDRVLAQIERIELDELYDAVRTHSMTHILDRPPDYPKMFRRCPELFGMHRSPSPELGAGDSFFGRYTDDDDEENIPPTNIPDLSLPFTLPAAGFSLKGDIPEFQAEDDDSPWKATLTRRADPLAHASDPVDSRVEGQGVPDAARALVNQGRMNRMGTGIGGMALEFGDSLQDAIDSLKTEGPFSSSPAASSSTSSSPRSSPLSLSPDSRASSVESSDDLSQLSHIIKSSILPTAASIVKVSKPIRASGWNWWTPQVVSDAESKSQPGTPSSSPSSNASSTFEDLFDHDSAMRGWEARVWGSEYELDTMLLAIQPPWHLPMQTFSDFTQSQEFTDGARGEGGFLSYEKLWATILDVCVARQIRYFSVCSFDHIAVGCFSQDYKTGYISPPIPTNRPTLPHGNRPPSFLQVLVYWMLSSMQCEDGWAINEPMIMVPLEADIRGHQFNPLANDPEIQRAPTPSPFLRGLKRTRLERTTGEVEIVDFDWGNANTGKGKGKGRAVDTWEDPDADEEREVENFLEEQPERGSPMDIDIVIGDCTYRRLGHHLVRMDPFEPEELETPAVSDDESEEDDEEDSDSDEEEVPRRSSRRSSASGPSTTAASSSRSKASTGARLIKALPRAATGSRKVSGGSTKVAPESIYQVHFNRTDVVRGGDNGGWINGRRQRADGRWEVNMDGDADADMMPEGEGEGVVAVGMPVAVRTSSRIRERKAKKAAEAAEATAAPQVVQPQASSSRSRQAPPPTPAKPSTRRLTKKSARRSPSLDEDDEEEVEEEEEEEEEQPKPRKRAKLMLVVSSSSTPRAGAQTRSRSAVSRK